MISEKLLSVLIHEYQTMKTDEEFVSLSMAEYLAKRIMFVESIRRERQLLQTETNAVYEASREKLANIEKQRQQMQKDCHHELTTYHADPSGGRDSHTSCDICGGEVP